MEVIDPGATDPAPVLRLLALAAAVASLLTALAAARRVRLGVPLVTPRSMSPAPWSGRDVAVVVGTLLWVQVLAAAVAPPTAPLASRLLVSVVGMVLATGLAGWYLRVAGASWHDIGLTGWRWGEGMRTALAALALVLWPLLALATLLDRVVPYRHPIIEYLGDHRGGAAMALVVLSAVVVAPVVEEFLFRRVLLGWLLRAWPVAGGLGAVAVQAMAFGMSHAGQGLAPVPLTLFGLVLGWLALRTGSLLPGILLHALFNAVSIGLVVWGPSV
ncbi:MAG: lysostaphin resistance A-like protein [Planctomycetaceae bacterium]